MNDKCRKMHIMKVLFPFWEKAFTNYIVILT